MSFSQKVRHLADAIDAACDRGDDRTANQLLRELADCAVGRLWRRGETYGFPDAARNFRAQSVAERTGFEPSAGRPADMEEPQ